MINLSAESIYIKGAWIDYETQFSLDYETPILAVSHLCRESPLSDVTHSYNLNNELI